MKTIFIIFVLGLFSLLPQAIHAVEKESDGGAMLAIHQTQTDSRVTLLRNYLISHNSPAASYADVFIAQADANSLDWKLVAAISGLESTFCQHIPNGSYNCWGWGIPTGAQSGIAFRSFAYGIATVSEGLRKNYLNRGYITIEQIGSIYAASPTWASRVRFFMQDIEKWNTSSNDPAHLSVTI